MTDTPSAPITVHASPTPDQINAGVRQTLLAASAVAGTLGFTGLSGQIGAAVGFSSIIAGVIVMVIGQLKTRSLSTKAATMANALPDSVAVTK